MKGGGPLGLSIVGGSDHTSHPFGVEEPGIFISKVNLLFHRFCYSCTKQTYFCVEIRDNFL